MSRAWFCPRHGYICAEHEVTRIKNHRIVGGCCEILDLRNEVVTFKLVEAPQA